MGFLDKLREKVETILEMGDSPKKKYYDFILNLLSTAECLSKEDIKKCYKVKMGEDCDDAVLDAVLEKFDTTKESKSGVTWYQRTIKQKFDEKIPESMLLFKTADEVYDICFSDFRESVRVRFAEVLDTIKDCAEEFHLEQACEVMMRYPGRPFPHTTLAGQVMGAEMVKRFLAYDPTVLSIILKKVYSELSYSYENYSEETITLLYAIALRAIHFEKFGTAADGYTSITAEDCANAVLNSKYYQSEIAKTPYHKDSIITYASKAILEVKPCYTHGEYTWGHWASADLYFVDAVCNFLWKRISSEHENENASDAENIVLTINDCIKKHN